MSAADQNLLLGVIALQVDFIGRDALVDGMQAWVQQKDRSLVEILASQGHLNERQAELLENLAREHVARIGGTAAEGLAALSSIGTVRSMLEEIEDAEINHTLASFAPRSLATTQPAQGPLPQRSSWSENTHRRFRILRTHARGGLGQVFLAEDDELHRNVALKEIIGKFADEPSNRERFVVEAEITGRLQHPGIVPVYGLGTYPDGRPFYAMRFIEGDNLLTAIEHFHHRASAEPWQGDLLVSFRELLSRFMDVCDAMQFAHERHVLHRDLKPHNIMLGEYGETLVVDWGLAKPLYEGRTQDDVPTDAIVPLSGSAIGTEQDGSVLGTPQYMPPEQAAGKIDQLTCQSDIYSLGATLYHLLTNQPPFQLQLKDVEVPGQRLSDSQKQRALSEMLQRVQAGLIVEPREIQPQIPRPLSAVCLRAMAKQPSERYASARELKQEIQRWLADEPVLALPEAWHERSARWFRHHRTLTLVGGSSLLMLCVLITVSALLIGRYRLAKIQQERITELSTDLEDMLQTSLTAGIPLNGDFFSQQFDPKFERLVLLDRDIAARRETSVLEAAAADIERRLTETTPSEMQLTQLEQDIDDWSQRCSERIDQQQLASLEQELRDLWERRKAPWTSLPGELAGNALKRALGDSQELAVDVDGIVTATPEQQSFGFFELTLSQLPPELNHEVVVVFDATSLNAPAVGIGLSPQTNRPEINQYQAVLCVKDFAAGQWSRSRLRRLPSLNESIGKGEQVRLLLCRGRTPLSETFVNLATQDFKLTFRREDDFLRVTLDADGATTKMLEFQDFLSFPHANRPGLWIGPDIGIDSVQLSYRALPAQRSELEQIKAMISVGNFSEALIKLELRNDRYSQYLRSRCLSQPGERLELLNQLLQQAPQINKDGAVLDVWHLQALLDAIELNEPNPERFRDLVLKLIFYYGSSLDQIAVRVPQRLRQKLLSEFRKLGGRWRVAARPEGDLIQLDTAVSLDQILEPDPVMRRATRWRRCDVWRVADRVEEARRELNTLLEEALADPAAEPGEAANLLRDLCWLLFARQRIPEVVTLLADLGSRANLRDDVKIAIELESARLAVHQNQLDAALERLAELLSGQTEQMRRVQYADACLLAGFVALDLNDRDRAQSFWKQGRVFQGTGLNRRNPDAARLHGTQMVEHAALITLDGTLGSMVNEFTEEEAQAGFDALVPEGGFFGAAGRAIVKTAFDRSLIRDLANSMYRSPSGMKVARKMTYRSTTFREHFAEPIILMLFEGVVLRGFRDYRDDAELMADAESDCRVLYQTYDSGGINEQDDMRLIVALWSGQATSETWETLRPKLPGTVAAGLALVGGRSQMLAAEETEDDREKESHLNNARIMLETARDHREVRDSFKRMARKFLQEIGS